MTRLQEMTKEAICSALYGMEFTRFLGEQADPVVGSDVAWFRLSPTPDREKVDWRQDPHFLMVRVQEDVMELVTVTCQCINVSGGEPLRAEVVLRIPTENVPEVQLHAATEQTVLRILDLYKQVLDQTGIAGPIEETAPESEYDGIGEDDLAVDGEEFE
jgi:hypothetical protein